MEFASFVGSASLTSFAHVKLGGSSFRGKGEKSEVRAHSVKW